MQNSRTHGQVAGSNGAPFGAGSKTLTPMREKMKRFLTAKVVIVFAAALLTVSVGTPARAGIPVLDYSNLVQNILAVIQRIQQLKEMSNQSDKLDQQIAKTDEQTQRLEAKLDEKLDPANETLTAQLDQLQQQLAIAQQNLKPVEEYTWDDADKTINLLVEAVGKLDDMENTIKKAGFQNMADYQGGTYGKCFQEGGCDDKTWADFQKQLKNSVQTGNQAQWENNNAWIKSLVDHKASLASDKDHLVQLQQKAGTAAGEMEALGYANEFASAQVNQLMQIRALLLAQQQAQAFNAQADVAKEGREALVRQQQTTPVVQTAAEESTSSAATDTASQGLTFAAGR